RIGVRIRFLSLTREFFAFPRYTEPGAPAQLVIYWAFSLLITPSKSSFRSQKGDLLMKSLFFAILIAFNLSSLSATAQEPPVPVSRATDDGIGQTGLQKELIGIRPQVGFLSYDNELGNTDGRLAFGALFDLNLVRLFETELLDPDMWSVGPS